MNRSLKLFTVAALAAGVAACGSDSSDSDATGTVSFGLTDAPATEFSNVTVAFTEIQLKPADGDWISFPLDGFETVNLLDLQGGVTEPLITDEEVVAGNYTQLRLIVDTDNSFIKLTGTGDTEYSLAVPSGEQSGLKLQGEFVVAADTSTDFTIDFDVQKAVINPAGQALAEYMLRPALRLVNNLEVGSITGEVDYSGINSGPVECEYEGSVYIYSGADVTPTDLNVNNEEGPLMVVPVSNEENDSLYNYTAAFLTEGAYTVSYSCQFDENEQDDALEFIGTQNVTVVAGEETSAETIQ